jgi:hypothetical protein
MFFGEQQQGASRAAGLAGTDLPLFSLVSSFEILRKSAGVGVSFSDLR